MSTAALIVAAGRGARAGRPGIGPKQYATLAGRSVLARSIDRFSGDNAIVAIQVVIHPDDGPLYAAAVAGSRAPLRPPVLGGARRQESVRAGLTALKEMNPRFVLIHDAARPLVPAEVILRVREALASAGGAIAALAVTDTLKHAGGGSVIRGTADRAGLWRAQTPQGFVFADILAAYQAAHAAGRDDFTDDAAVAEWAGIDVVLVPGSERNIKLTTAEDFSMAERLLAAAPDVRTGTGFDAHRFGGGDHVWLCGVKIPHTSALVGHSDADVGLHALTDAILGAIAESDIGEHFPPGDPRWKGTASRVFLEDAVRRVRARGGSIGNADITLICQEPRIAPHRQAMRQAIAGILGIGLDRVAVKATTTEGLGFAGRREGIAAMAIATVVLPAGGTVAARP